MKKKTAAYLVLLLFLSLSTAIISACIYGPSPKPDKQDEVSKPTEPPDNPPPPPPPPPRILLSESPSGESLTMEVVAYMVLRGDYGPEIRALLADEVSVVVTGMAQAGMVSVFSAGGDMGVRLLDGEKKSILYDDGYLVRRILAGTYGRMAMENLHVFARSFESERVIP